MSRKIRITIDLDLSLLEWIEKYATDRGISRNQAVAEAIESLKHEKERVEMKTSVGPPEWTAKEIVDMVGKENVEVVVQDGDVTWCIAPYQGKWITWNDAEPHPEMETFRTKKEAIMYHVLSAIDSECEDRVLGKYQEFVEEAKKIRERLRLT